MLTTKKWSSVKSSRGHQRKRGEHRKAGISRLMVPIRHAKQLEGWSWIDCMISPRLELGIFSDTPLHSSDWKWIRAKVPRQADNSNDCGIFMSCLASLFIEKLIDEGYLIRRMNTNSYCKVEVAFSIDVDVFGTLGREHMHSPEETRTQHRALRRCQH